MSTASDAELTNRHYALLRAVAAGRCELTGSCRPDMFIDGRSSCDQHAVHLLASAGLIRHAAPAEIGQRVPAQLTEAGRDVLNAHGQLADAA